MTPREHLPLSDAEIRAFCQKHRIRRFAFFGSVLRGDFGPASDVGMLVEFEPQHVPGLLKLAAMERELSAMIGGRRVDMRTPGDLSRYFRDDVIAHAVVQYAQGGVPSPRRSRLSPPFGGQPCFWRDDCFPGSTSIGAIRAVVKLI